MLVNISISNVRSPLTTIILQVLKKIIISCHTISLDMLLVKIVTSVIIILKMIYNFTHVIYNVIYNNHTGNLKDGLPILFQLCIGNAFQL